jgi:hypothetical protein
VRSLSYCQFRSFNHRRLQRHRARGESVIEMLEANEGMTAVTGAKSTATEPQNPPRLSQCLSQ